MNWLPLALFTALCLALYNFFIKQASAHLPAAVGAVVEGGVWDPAVICNGAI